VYIDSGTSAECDNVYASATTMGLKEKNDPEHAFGNLLNHNATQPTQRTNCKLDIKLFASVSDQCPSAASSVR
jgi:hypothetical protein